MLIEKNFLYWAITDTITLNKIGLLTMADPIYQVPNEVRDFAEKSVEQARKAFEGFAGRRTRPFTLQAICL